MPELYGISYMVRHLVQAGVSKGIISTFRRSGEEALARYPAAGFLEITDSRTRISAFWVGWTFSISVEELDGWKEVEVTLPRGFREARFGALARFFQANPKRWLPRWKKRFWRLMGRVFSLQGFREVYPSFLEFGEKEEEVFEQILLLHLSPHLSFGRVGQGKSFDLPVWFWVPDKGWKPILPHLLGAWAPPVLRLYPWHRREGESLSLYASPLGFVVSRRLLRPSQLLTWDRFPLRINPSWAQAIEEGNKGEGERLKHFVFSHLLMESF